MTFHPFIRPGSSEPDRVVTVAPSLASFTREQLDAELASRGFDYRGVLNDILDSVERIRSTAPQQMNAAIAADIARGVIAVLAGNRTAFVRPGGRASVIHDASSTGELLRISTAFAAALNSLGEWDAVSAMHAATVLACHIASRLGSSSDESSLAQFFIAQCDGDGDRAMAVMRREIARRAEVKRAFEASTSGGPS